MLQSPKLFPREESRAHFWCHFGQTTFFRAEIVPLLLCSLCDFQCSCSIMALLACHELPHHEASHFMPSCSYLPFELAKFRIMVYLGNQQVSSLDGGAGVPWGQGKQLTLQWPAVISQRLSCTQLCLAISPLDCNPMRDHVGTPNVTQVL